MSADKAFAQYQKKGPHLIPHRPDCHCKGWQVPINECTCDCYEHAIFKAGYQAAKGIAGNAN
jgi:hypothetical protein